MCLLWTSGNLLWNILIQNWWGFIQLPSEWSWSSVLLRFLCLYWVLLHICRVTAGGHGWLRTELSLFAWHLKTLSLLLGVREEGEGIKLWQEGVDLTGINVGWEQSSGGKRSNGCGSRGTHGDLQHLLTEGRGQRREGKEVVKPHGELQWKKYFKPLTLHSHIFSVTL